MAHTKPIPPPWRSPDPLQAMATFSRGKDPAQVSLKRLVRRLERAGITYAVMGGMAVYVHGHERFTKDVDVLLTRQGLDEFRSRFAKHYQQVEGRPRRFIDKQNGVTVDFLATGLVPGHGQPCAITFPDPADVRELINKVYYIDLVTLIQLKLAARRHQDFADVVNLINVHNLDETYLDRLHPSLQRDFLECLDEKRREEEYLKRNG